MPGYVYILKDENGKNYIGSTNDLERRLKQHLSGHTYTTRKMKNPTLVFSQVYNTLIQARRIELRLKKLKRKDYINQIIVDGFIKIS